MKVCSRTECQGNYAIVIGVANNLSENHQNNITTIARHLFQQLAIGLIPIIFVPILIDRASFTAHTEPMDGYNRKSKLLYTPAKCLPVNINACYWYNKP